MAKLWEKIKKDRILKSKERVKMVIGKERNRKRTSQKNARVFLAKPESRRKGAFLLGKGGGHLQRSEKKGESQI